MLQLNNENINSNTSSNSSANPNTNSKVVAAIDIGSNSFHLLIVKVDNNGLLTTLARFKESIRLAAGDGDEIKKLKPEAMLLGVEILSAFAKIANSYGAVIKAVATSATREALNSVEFMELVRQNTGIEIEIVSGSEEGRLTYLGVSYCIPIYEKKAMVIDIGGGSTETVIGMFGDILFANSEKLGAVRLTQRFFADGFTQENINKCRNYVKGKLSPVMQKMNEIGFAEVIGTAGTFETIVRVAFLKKNKELPDFVNGLSISTNSMLSAINNIINAQNPAEISKIIGVEEKRTDIILAGSIILEYLLKNCGLKKVMFSPYALREGIIYDTIQKLDILDKFSQVGELRKTTIYNLAKKFKVDMAHAKQVLKNSLIIYDALDASILNKTHINLNKNHREMLGYAALLHDIGYYISHDMHHKHSLYLIQHSDLPGFTNDEANFIANIARYHRKSHPKKVHLEYAMLQDKKRQSVKILAGILRLSEGTDRRRKQLVNNITANFSSADNKLIITLYSSVNHELDIEQWGADRRKLLLAEVLGCEIEIIIEKEKIEKEKS